ncbi:MAG TPA: hypothetical protein VHG28_17290 [Longimicrobiaceae bacterium]|nr:hypothetical protein [Longimicrobiaceae bacterium]
MIVEEPYLQLLGKSFSPALAERQTGLSFTERNEVGELGTRGKYEGIPLPFGSATLQAPPEVDPSERLDWILDSVLPHAEALRNLGGMEGWLHSTFYFDAQCNLAYPPGQLQKLSQLGIPYTVSCIQAPERFGGAEPVRAA